MPDTPRPWDRRTTDSDPAYDAVAAYLDTGSLKTRVRWRVPSPSLRATASVVLSETMRRGTPPTSWNAALCPSQNAAVVSAGQAFTNASSRCGRSTTRSCALRSTPSMTTSASPTSAWASPGGGASGTNIACPSSFCSRT